MAATAGQRDRGAVVERGGEWKVMYTGDSGWIWLGAALGMIVFWGLIIALGVLVLRARTGDKSPGEKDSDPAGADPRQVLAERYARGEIAEEEYRRRLATLSGTGDAPRPVARR